MNLSHYQSLHPTGDCGACQTRIKAGGQALPAHHQTPLLLLDPRPGLRGLTPRAPCLARPAPLLRGLPDPLRALRAATLLAARVPPRFGLIPWLRREALQPTFKESG